MAKEAKGPHERKHRVMLVVNKADLLAISTKEAKYFAERQKIPFFIETSALEAATVDNAYIEVVTQFYQIVS
ncbi:unnamed protein product [Cochlearia groenlandica]